MCWQWLYFYITGVSEGGIAIERLKDAVRRVNHIKKHCNINNKGHFLPTVGWISASVFPARFTIHYDLSSINCKSVRQSRKTLKTYFQIKSPVRKFSFSDDNNFLLVCPPTLPIFDKLYFSETRGVVPTCTAPKDRLFNIWDSL